MKSLGQQYEDLLRPHVSSKAPSIPFFSTVTNTIVDKEGVLDAHYWRANLESPVLFNTGVKILV